jgi:hypothetical protein
LIVREKHSRAILDLLFDYTEMLDLAPKDVIAAADRVLGDIRG